MRLKRISLLLPLAGALLFAAPAAASQVYVTGSTGDAISPFAIGSGGALTPIACGASCNTGSQPIGVAVSPNGQYLYAANHGTSRVSPYTIGASGSLTPISCAGSNCNTGTNPYGVAVSPNGQFVYTTSLGTDSVSAFSVGSGGSLTRISCGSNCNAGGDPFGVAVTPNGQFLYTANRESNTVSAFSVNANGSLTPISCGATCNAGVWPQAIAVSPNGQFLYVANRNSARVSVYSIGANGSLTPVSCTTNCNTGTAPMSMAITPNGQRLYTVNRNGQNVSAFSINANGTLTPVSCPGSNCNTGPIASGIAVSPDSKHLYASSFGDNRVSPFTIGPGGGLFPIGCPGSNCNTAAGPDFQSLVVSPVQAPTAAFTATPAKPGEVTSFNGSASSASSGQTVARYDWDFGDGEVATNAGPTPTHVYDSEDNYTVRLTVTDNAGCSTTLTYTGQTASCNGSSVATKTQIVPVGDPPLTIIDSPRIRVRDNPMPTFSFHATETGSTFECSIDTGTPSFGPCSGPGASHTPASPLGIGFYAFRVRATDPLGFTGPAAIRMFRIDTVKEPKACPAVSSSVRGPRRSHRAGRRAAPARKGTGRVRRVAGVRAKLTVDRPSELVVKARLRWKRKRSWRTTNLGTHSLAAAGTESLRLTLPRSLAKRLRRGSAVKLKLRVAAYPDAAPGCVDRSVERLSLRTRVVRVPVGSKRR